MTKPVFRGLEPLVLSEVRLRAVAVLHVASCRAAGNEETWGLGAPIDGWQLANIELEGRGLDRTGFMAVAFHREVRRSGRSSTEGFPLVFDACLESGGRDGGAEDQCNDGQGPTNETIDHLKISPKKRG